MRCFLIILLFLCFIDGYGQKFDAGVINLKLGKINTSNNGSMTIFDDNEFKITIKTGISPNIVNSVLITEIGSDNINAENYLSMGKYDIRLKVYVSKLTRLIVRFVNTSRLVGIPDDKIFYLIGFTHKF